MNADTDERVRLTVSLPVPVHAAFERLAKVSGSSIGREIGDFLAEMVESVEFTASKMEQARDAPRLAMREMHAYALGLADETGEIVRRMASSPPGGRRDFGATPTGVAGGSPPPSNTGGKVPPVGGSKSRGPKGSSKGRR